MVSIDSTSVQTYVGILQTVINRMAANSAGCKTWCITLVSAILVIVATVGKPDFIWISLFPVFLFSVLDSFYLGLERRFQTLYNSFIHKLHSNTAKIEDLFVITQRVGVAETLCSTLNACKSVSIWLFYGVLGVMLVAVRIWIL